MFCASASAEGLTAKALSEGCRGSTLERLACVAYVEGFSHGWQILSLFQQDWIQV